MKIMAVDLGDVRTGLAACDRTEFLASPIGVIENNNPSVVLNEIAIAAKEYAVDMIVVGYPKNMDGSAGDRAEKCETFARKLHKLSKLPVKLWDERLTTVSAHQALSATNVRGQKRKDVVDEVAATIILENFLSYKRNNPDMKIDFE